MEYRFNKKSIGHEICYIKQDGKLKKDAKTVSIAVKGNSSKEFDQIALESNQEFQLMPRKDKDREITLISGIQNSGKSFFIKNYIQSYRKTLGDKIPIYLFSDLKSDKTLEEVENEFKRIAIDDNLIKDPITMDEFEEVYKTYKRFLIIFDDIDNITNKKINDVLYNLIKSLIHIGRHWGIDILFSNHSMAERNKTKDILNSADNIVIFPFSGITRSIKYAMDEYFDIDEKKLKDLKKLNSRWVILTRSNPRMIISEKKIMFLED